MNMLKNIATVVVSFLIGVSMMVGSAHADPAVMVEHFNSPQLYAISDDGCLIVPSLHFALCWEDNADGFVSYRMNAGQDPSEWQEIGTLS